MDSEKIVEAAMYLFWEQGYQATSVEEIAKVLKVVPAEITRYFRNKDDLYRAACCRYQQKMETERISKIEQAQSPAKGVEQFFSAVTGQDNPDIPAGCLMTSALLERSNVDSDINQLTKSFLLRLQKAFYDALAKAQTLGELKPGIDPREQSQVFLSLLQGINVLAKAFPGSTMPSKVAKSALSQCFAT